MTEVQNKCSAIRGIRHNLLHRFSKKIRNISL